MEVIGKKPFDFVGRYGRHHQKALHAFATDARKEDHLLFGFDPFGGGLEAAASRQIDYRLNDRTSACSPVYRRHETAVDLDAIYLESAQMTEGRIARTEIVERDSYAYIAQPAQVAT